MSSSLAKTLAESARSFDSTGSEVDYEPAALRIARPSAKPASGVPVLAGPARLGCRELFKSYQKGSVGIPVLQGVHFDVSDGEFVAIIGASGSGKSTLLHLLGTLDKPDAGEVLFDGNRIDNLPATSRDLLRNRHFGMIFQAYHLLPELTAFENVLAPAYIYESTLGYWAKRKQYRQRAMELLELVGLADRAKHKPSELSGGEMQRTAIARALMLKPEVLLADEPTGNLDRSTGDQVMKTLCELNEKQNLTIIMVTHDPLIAGQADRTVQIAEGRIVG
ncbi:ABC transporter ATP-binding protein [Adhaeretor mobilis]|uniref:P-loop containing nucleoside triphosphate hydrolase n=1 Tax=Adhaeretor mobilis TaxID=1930276 RepID=A0A517MTB4_9BACT|nr:ABC transporter ATP-binding protein [Adhaeretor mobilis]QDS98114.1 P-loop containing nucleoside triphosphate hydrolase [Adhaeretor mobilis]